MNLSYWIERQADFVPEKCAIRFAGKAAEPHYWRSAVLYDLGRLDEALKSIERCFRYLRVDDFWLREDLYCDKAMILDALGRNDDAVATYEAGLKRCPQSSLLTAGLAPLRRAKSKSDTKSQLKLVSEG